MSIEVLEYVPEMRYDIEVFRDQTIAEGNESLIRSKFDPENFEGKIWTVYRDGKMISISAVEASHYTGDPDVSARICRYHILKEHRHSHCGFMMLQKQIEWAEQTKAFKLLYFTHDIHNRALNAMYQHRKRMLDADAKGWFESDWYKRVNLDTRLLFRVSEKSDFLQYLYRIDIEENYDWTPSKSVIWFDHDGQINGMTNAEIIENSKGA